jgi:hypothetical protein
MNQNWFYLTTIIDAMSARGQRMPTRIPIRVGIE